MLTFQNYNDMPDTGTIVAIIGMGLSCSAGIIGVYVSMSIKQALAKQAIEQQSQMIKMLQAKVSEIEKETMHEIKQIHEILVDIKLKIEQNKHQL